MASKPIANHNLPVQNTTFVGRLEEIAAIADKLDKKYCRLLTLVGPGGIGKTRLAIQVASTKLEHFEDGVYFVSLQSVSSSAFVIPAIADALGFSSTGQATFKEQLLDYLREKQLLLILDNIEHLLDVSVLLSEFVTTAPGVQLLVTSREVLNLQEEWVHHVEGMRVPGDTPIEGIESYSAVKLFDERARQVQRNFSIAAHQDCVIRICQLVDGMPLGIELATAWLKTLPCAEIANSIANNLEFLESPHRNPSERHRSIRAVFEHSWKLLSDEEQAAFAKLSVFWGSFSHEAAEQAAGASLVTLSSLVDKSMLRINRAGRYEIHELLRQFAHEQLVATGSVGELQDAHSAYYLVFLRDREVDIKGRRQLAALDEIDAELENIRAAWRWAVDQRHYELIDSSMECWRLFCGFRNHWLEGKEFFRYAMDRCTADSSDDALSIWGRLLTRHTSFHGLTTSDEEVAAVEKGLTIARQQGNHEEEAFCLLTLVGIYLHLPGSDRASARADQSLAHYRTLGDKFNMAIALQLRAQCYRRNRQFEKSIRLWQQSCDLTREIGDGSGLSYSLQWLGINTFQTTGDFKDAEHYLREAYQIRCEINQPDGIAASGSAWGETLLLRGDLETARSLASEAIELQTKTRGGWGAAKAWAQRKLALIAIAEGDYKEAWNLLAISRFEDSHDMRANYDSAVRLALACCGLGDYDIARTHVGAALQVNLTNFALVFWTQILPPTAMILAHEGETELATQILGLAFTYPGTLVAMMQDWSIVTDLKAQLKAKLGSDDYAANWDKGSTLDLLAVIAMLRERFDTDTDQSAPVTSQTLLEPLSERELEVLHLVAKGLSNREIAQELVVTVGAIKKHNHNIFGKLHVSNRTQAVARARALNLIP